jgi:sigma-B regulation protein RsbU (phosphoserine phosphatase)
MNRQDMFVTMLYGVLDLEDLGFDYARAGHPAPLLVRDKRQLIEAHNGPCRPLALFSPMILDVQQIQLQRGDTLMLYTDGVTDAADEENHEFGTDRLRQAMLEICARVERPACSDFVQLIDEFRGSASHSDDLTMVLLNAF